MSWGLSKCFINCKVCCAKFKVLLVITFSQLKSYFLTSWRWKCKFIEVNFLPGPPTHNWANPSAALHLLIIECLPYPWVDSPPTVQNYLGKTHSTATPDPHFISGWRSNSQAACWTSGCLSLVAACSLAQSQAKEGNIGQHHTHHWGPDSLRLWGQARHLSGDRQAKR
jgi:hypothetical protein